MKNLAGLLILLAACDPTGLSSKDQVDVRLSSVNTVEGRCVTRPIAIAKMSGEWTLTAVTEYGRTVYRDYSGSYWGVKRFAAGDTMYGQAFANYAGGRASLMACWRTDGATDEGCRVPTVGC